MRRLLKELKRRKVYRVAAVYAAVAFVVVEAADLVFPALNIPSRAYSLVVVLALLGFPLALVLAWAFDLTPEGVRRTPAAEAVDSKRGGGAKAATSSESGWSPIRIAATGLVVLGLLSAVTAGGWYLLGSGGDADAASESVDRSVAVLPFDNMGGEESRQFTEGVHDGLLTKLSNISDLEVISRTSVMQFLDSQLPLPAIADSLDAQWIVEGAVQQAGDQVQVNAQLIQAEEDAHQWAQTYRRELSPENVFAIQSELTQRIARSLEAELSPEEQQRVERQPTEDLEAYQLYVQGRQRFARRSITACPSCPREAVEFFHQAIERDSTFALVWAGLADVATVASSPFFSVPDSLLANPERAAQRALELAPDLAEAHASLGYIHLLNVDAPAAVQELQEALELKPSYWEAHNWLGELYLKIGRAEQALKHLELAVDLNPQHASARHWLYDAYLATGQTEKSLAEARRQRRMGLEEGSAVGGEVRALMALGRLKTARRLAEEQVADRDVGDVWGDWFRAYLAEILAAQGDLDGAGAYLDELQAADVPPWRLAWAYAGLGRVEEAVETYRRLEGEDWGVIGPNHHLRYWVSLLDGEPLHDDLRYRELIREANRVWGLNPDGSLPDSVDVSFSSSQANE